MCVHRRALWLSAPVISSDLEPSAQADAISTKMKKDSNFTTTFFG